MSEFDRLKAEGNALLKVGKLGDAIEKYTDAIAAAEDGKQTAVALGNRSLAHLRMGNAAGARDDAEACKVHDPGHPKAQYRLDQACKALAPSSASAAPPAVPAAAPAPAPPSATGSVLCSAAAELKEKGNAFYKKGH